MNLTDFQNSIYYFDCAGICDGDAIVDDCGECGGDGSSCSEHFNVEIDPTGSSTLFIFLDFRISAGFDLKTSEYAAYFGLVFAHGGEDKYWSFGIMKKMDGLDEKAELIIRSIMGFHF